MKIELTDVLKVTKDDGTTTIINEGNYIVCCVDENRYYIGTLSKFWYWQANELKALPDTIVICTKLSETINGFSIILLSDVKWIDKANEDEKAEFEELLQRYYNQKYNTITN